MYAEGKLIAEVFKDEGGWGRLAVSKGGDSGWWGYTQFVHGRSRMTIRPSHPYYAGTEHVGFSPTRQTLLAPRAKRREVFGKVA